MMTSWFLRLLCTSFVVIEPTVKRVGRARKEVTATSDSDIGEMTQSEVFVAEVDDLATAALMGAAREAEAFSNNVHKVIFKEHKTTTANTPTATPSTPVTTVMPMTSLISTSSNTPASTRMPSSSTPLPPNTTRAPSISTLLALSTTPSRSTTALALSTSPGGLTTAPLPTSTQLPPSSTQMPSSTSPLPLCPSSGVSPLHKFFNITFTPANGTGQFGPTLAALRDDMSYKMQAWTQDACFLNMAVQGVQIWIVPQSGLYNFTVVGASGASTISTRRAGGVGIIISIPNVVLPKGENIYIVVGQKGLVDNNPGQRYVGGGGGASFVFSGNGSLLVVAGGGGGASGDTNGVDAVGEVANGTSGNPGGSGGNSTAFAQGGCSSDSGSYMDCQLPTGSPGGFGLGGDGANTNNQNGGGGGGASFGNATSSYIGGVAQNGQVGGFGGGGGGGASNSHRGGGGGGGGYYGGGGGDAANRLPNDPTRFYECSGGGGSSFVAADIAATSSLNTNPGDGNGYVSVALL